MKFLSIAALIPSAVATAIASRATATLPTVCDPVKNVTYLGLERNGIDVFLGIPYGQDTSGVNRFKPPVPFVPSPGDVIDAQSYGPACPQMVVEASFPFSLSDVSDISENCLNLNIARPKAGDGADVEPLGKGKGLPVMVYIHGGSFWSGQNRELNIAPDGLILQSLENETPVIHVAMNYRLGVFGFAQSDALYSEGSLNAGLRDQRLAIEWVRDNIAQFGGDPERITIFGQSSGGLAVGMQVMAYGASAPVPFQQAICESQALEPGITGNFTIDAMQAVVDAIGCNSSSLQSPETVACLRDLDTEALLNASLATYASDIGHNVGDIWLPVVDGDFLPDSPSQLIAQGRFANVTSMMGWCQDDLTYFTDTSITTSNDTLAFISAYVPDMTPARVDELLSLYPLPEFTAEAASKDGDLSPEFYRAARIFRDILMTCPPILYGARLASRGNAAYLYDWNQTMLDLPLAVVDDAPGMGVIHTSEFAYIFGNISHYNISGYPFDPTPEDWALEKRGSRSWATFAATGQPGIEGRDTFQGFEMAFDGEQVRVFVVGGGDEGLSAIDGSDAKPALAEQRLRERCGFINSPEIIGELRF
ncbi:putative Carboxylic ester hydrolase [Seiridium unicorne]|uniref:Carboxylic ester hydrolase n=1 Tax=Seiridium unicorne TaxID=138068 RepID=A0ABR2UJY9_9PEZI